MAKARFVSTVNIVILHVVITIRDIAGTNHHIYHHRLPSGCHCQNVRTLKVSARIQSSACAVTILVILLVILLVQKILSVFIRNRQEVNVLSSDSVLNLGDVNIASTIQSTIFVGAEASQNQCIWTFAPRVNFVMLMPTQTLVVGTMTLIL